MSAKSYIKRYLFFLLGVAIMSFGLAFSIKASLGPSPISSLPSVLNQINGWTVGTWTIIVNLLLILSQILILRKNFKLYQLMQIPVSLAFGYIVDIAIAIINGLTCTTYPMQLVFCFIGLFLVGLGIAFELVAGVIMMAGESTVNAICQVTNKEFPKVKTIFDTCMVSTSAIISLVYFHTLKGVREGTVIAALLVGTVVKITKPYVSKLEKYLD